MDHRKDYAAPAIEWEDILEQTSLACHATQPGTIPPRPGDPFAPGLLCDRMVHKRGAFIEGSCENAVAVPWPDAIVILS